LKLLSTDKWITLCNINEYKIVVVGRGCVGKSAIIIQFIQNYFVEIYDPTVEDTYRRQVCLDNEVFVLDILDTAGQEEYSSMCDYYMKFGDGFLCVYSINRRDSFEAIAEYYEKVLYIKDCSQVPSVIVGNKCDLISDREVNLEELKKMAKLYNAGYTEASAKLKINIDKCFSLLIKEIKKCIKPAVVIENTISTTKRNQACIVL